MGNFNLTKNVEIREVLAPVSASSSIDSNSDRIDMSGVESATFIVPITDSVDTGVATLQIQQNSIDSDNGMATLEGTATATSAANDDLNNTLLVLEVYRPTERYIQANITSATANIAYGNMTVLLHYLRKQPVSEHASVQDMNLIIEPDEA